MKLNKKVLSIALGVAGLGFVGSVSAHTYTDSIAASALANRHDLIQTTCFSWGNGVHPAAVAPEVNGAAQRFVASLGGTGAGLTIQALPNGAVVNNAAASLSQATQYAAGTFAIPNNGVYFVKINRAAASGAATPFTATFHCSNTSAGGINAPHTGTGENFTGDVGNVQPTVDYKVLVNQ